MADNSMVVFTIGLASIRCDAGTISRRSSGALSVGQHREKPSETVHHPLVSDADREGSAGRCTPSDSRLNPRPADPVFARDSTDS